MNKQVITYILGFIMKIESVLMLPPLLIGLYYHEDVTGFLVTIALLVIIGFALSINKPKDDVFLAKDGYIAVGMSWIILSLFGALPFYISGTIPNYIDAFFEIVSGFTTTGATILTDIEVVDRGLLFWRSFSHWIGGMGILVFMLAIIPVAQGKSMHLMRAESPGPTVGKLVPKLKQTAKLLYMMYCALSILEVIALLLAGLPLYDSFIHMFGTAGTGGFSIWNDSVAHYDSAVVEMIIMSFLFLFAMNFNIFYLVIMRKSKQIFKNDELKVYIMICIVSVLLIAFNILPLFDSLAEAFRYAGFQVASIISTAGYSTANFDLWPEFSKMVLMCLMFIGGCAGSTAGGMKVSRIILLFKNVKHEIRLLIRPRDVSNVCLGGHPVETKVRNNTNVFFVVYFIIFAFSVLFISLDGFDFMTNFSGVAACINNVGPGFSLVGPMGNFADFSVLSKLILSLDMLLGRLEIFPLLLMLWPQVYKHR